LVTTSFSKATVTKQNNRSDLAVGPSKPSDFWEFLHSWGGKWMWEGIDNSQSTKHDMTWAVDGMKNHTLIWVTDGSYDKDRAIDICSVGWIIFCTATGNRLTGLCWERSNGPSSYIGEMLGLCALHLFARALSEYFKVNKWRATICCNNQRALECSSHHPQRIN